MIKLRYIRAIVIAISICSHTSCCTENTVWDNPAIKPADDTTNNANTSMTKPEENIFTEQSTVADVVGDRAFGTFGHLLFPVDRNISPSMTLAQISTSSVYMWYPYIRAEKTVEIINYLHAQAVSGREIFYNIYTPQEISRDPGKADTGLFVFRGELGKPYAITNAGGGFAYVGAMHDSFPHSLELCRAGYTAFALIYRPDDPYSDLARAISFINDNAEKLGVSKENYSLWGGSAGARMAATLGNKDYLTALTGDASLPQAAAVIMQYTGYSTASKSDAPTYNCVGSNDGIASWHTMQNRLRQLSAMGIATEFHVYDGLGHGFGIGTGTVAEGWVDDAIRFWEANIKKDGTTGIPPVYATK